MTLHAPPLPSIVERPPKGQVLVVAPHPDDEMIGPGGALLLHAEQGDPIRIIIVCNGVNGDPEGFFERAGYVERRAAESRGVAAEFLKTTDLFLYGYPDSLDDSGLASTFPSMPADPESRKRALIHGLAANLADHVRAVDARTIYYPWSGEFHVDHWAIGAAVDQLIAGSPEIVAGRSFLGYEVWSTLLPDTLVDVTPVIEKKLEAIGRYATQVKYCDYAEVVGGLNLHRGLLMGKRDRRWAEAFIGRYAVKAEEPKK